MVDSRPERQSGQVESRLNAIGEWAGVREAIEPGQARHQQRWELEVLWQMCAGEAQ